MGVLHKDLTGADLHRPGYIQSADPGAVGTGILWIDTTDTSNLVLRIRNAADDGWDLVGTEGLSFQGAWSDSTEYFAGEVVTHNGTAYVANAQHTNSEPPSANWDILAEKGDKGAPGAAGADGEDGPLWRGDWSSATSYAINDAVHHNGSAYIATAANSNSEPPSANWDLFAAQGDGIGAHQAAGIADHDNVDLTGAAQNDGFIRNASGIYVRKPYASQAEAEAGTVEGKWMSPLRTAQAIAALASGGGGVWTELASVTLASSAASIDFTGLSATGYRQFLVEFMGSISINAGPEMRLNDDSGASQYSYHSRGWRLGTDTPVVARASSNRISLSAVNGGTGEAPVFIRATIGKKGQADRASGSAFLGMAGSGSNDGLGGTSGYRWNNTADWIDKVSLLFVSGTPLDAGSTATIFGREIP